MKLGYARVSTILKKWRCRVFGHRPDEADIMVALLKKTAIFVVNPGTSIRCRRCGGIMGTVEFPR